MWLGMSDVLSRVLNVVKVEYQVTDVSPETRFGFLGDSLDLVECGMAIEEEFGNAFRLDDKKLHADYKNLTVGDMARMVEGLINE